MLKYYRCIENDEIMSINQVHSDFLEFSKENPEYENMSFCQYLNGCMTYNNGSLEEVKLYTLARGGAYWDNKENHIVASWDDENGYFLSEKPLDNRKFYIYKTLSDDEIIVYTKA